MKVNVADIQRRFQEMADSDLLAVSPCDLSEQGRDCYKQETDRRGLSVDTSLPEISDDALVERALETSRRYSQEAAPEAPAEAEEARSTFGVNVDDMEERYRLMTDEELLAITPADLTARGLACYLKAVQQRGLKTNSPVPAASSSNDDPVSLLLSNANRWSSQARSLRALTAGSFAFGLYRVTHSPLLYWLAGGGLALLIEAAVRKRNRGREAILWLRKFRASSGSMDSFELLLTTASEGLGTPVTIRDPVVSYSFDRGMATANNLKFLIFPLMLVCAASGLFLGVDNLYVLPALLLLGSLLLIPRLGITDITGGDTATATERQLKRIKQGKVTPMAAAMVLKCEAEDWQQVVATAQALSSAIVLDLTDLSDNMLWELNLALRLKAPEAIILAHRLEPDQAQEIPPVCLSALRKHFGQDVIAKCPVFLYPAGKQSRKQAQAPIQQLRRHLAAAIVYSKSVAANSR